MLFILILRLIAGAQTASPGDAELPRVYLNTALSATPSNGRIVRLKASDNLQRALDGAQCGDRILLPAGAKFSGNFSISRECSAASWITVMTDGCPSLPAEGTRTSPAAAACYAKLVSKSVNPALSTKPSAKFWRVIGVELTNEPNLSVVYSTVLLGDASDQQNSLAKVPSDLILDRVYVHAPDATDDRRCISLQSARSAVIDSYVSNCKSAFDAQAITSTNSPGPLKIVNNFLEATGENIAFGGGDPHIPGLVPSDIEIRHNYFFKRLDWKGNQWGQNEKNLLESKNSSHVLVEGNVFENSWVAGQYGWVLALYSVNQDGQCTWCITEHWTFRNNLVKNVTSFATITARLSNFPQAIPPKAHHITVRNNLVVGLNPQFVSGVGKVFQLWDISYLTIEHNTAFGSDGGFSFDQAAPSHVVIRNNLVAGCYPVFSAGGQGTAALTYGTAADRVFAGNVLFGCGSPPFTATNPVPGNTYPRDWPGLFDRGANPYVVTTDPATLVVSPRGPYKGKGTDGKDPGADVAAVLTAVKGVVPP